MLKRCFPPWRAQADQVRRKGDKDVDGSILQEDVSVPITLACVQARATTHSRMNTHSATAAAMDVAAGVRTMLRDRGKS